MDETTEGQRYKRGEFTAKELNNSIPFDYDRRLRGEAGKMLADDLMDRMNLMAPRVRALKKKDHDFQVATVEALLSNLIVARFNRIDPERFVALSFGTSNYSGTLISVTYLRAFRDTLLANNLIEGQGGYHKFGWLGHTTLGQVTRLRATSALDDLFEQYGVSYRSVSSLGNWLIRVTKSEVVRADQPSDVSASSGVLARCNALLASSDIAVPEVAWQRLPPTSDLETDTGDQPSWRGDLTAISLYRRFSNNYTRGGRIYGGWWMLAPKDARKRITIDGQDTVELDYGYLHPSILYARTGRKLDFDPYVTSPHCSRAERELGKITFMRMLNDGDVGKPRKLPARISPEHQGALPVGMTFKEYVGKLASHLSDISRWFGIGEGVRLQREDSMLVISVLDTLNSLGIVTLPIHDSFIVQERHKSNLHEAMERAYEVQFGVKPTIK